MKSKVIFSIVAVCLVFFGYAPVESKAEFPPLEQLSVPNALDYAHPKSWLALPANPNRFKVDVFWVYPTVPCKKNVWIMDPADSAHRQAAHHTVVSQASVFNQNTNIYAPLYRQMSVRCLALPAGKRDKLIRYGEDDVRRALDYYLKYYNKGKPFILAGHSQGSNVLTDLILKKWGKTKTDSRLVAAYLIGWSVTKQNLRQYPGVKMCRSARQNGCLISYNSVAAGRQSAAPTILPGAVVVNPLSWEINNKPIPAGKNFGAVFLNTKGQKIIRPHFTSAQAVNGGLVVSPADASLTPQCSPTFPQGVYHCYDYSLFYENIKANVKERIQTYQK